MNAGADEPTPPSRAGLPDPSLVVLVGAFGSGKAEWAARTFAPGEVISLAALTQAVGKNERDVTAIPAAFGILNRIVSERLGRGLTVVIDSDGLDSGRRLGWHAAAVRHSIPAFAVLLAASLDRCLERNAERAHPLPETVIKRQVTRCLEIGPEIAEEGFHVFVVREPDGGFDAAH